MIDVDTLLAWGAAYKKLLAEEIIFSEGMQSNFYYQLVSGRVRWVNINEEGKETIQEICEPGDCFGELPLFDDGPFAATAIACTDTIVLRLHKSTFLQLIHENPEIHLSFSRLLAGRVRFKFMIQKEMSCHHPEHNISALFKHFKNTQTHISLNYNMVTLTRQEIANMVGLRVETVIRVIRGLQDRGELYIEKGKVYLICDSDHNGRKPVAVTLEKQAAVLV